MDETQRSLQVEDNNSEESCNDGTNVAGPSQLTRSQSLHNTQRNGKRSLPRLPRPLPPVPLTRPSSPVDSDESLNGCRPLPLPPVHADEVEPALQSAPASLDPTPSLDQNQKAQTPPLTFLPSPSGEAASPDDDLLSPLTPTSPDTGYPDMTFASTQSSSSINTLLTTPTLAKNRSRRDGRIHSSPYKCARNPARFSLTSLSSQISVPPHAPYGRDPSAKPRQDGEASTQVWRVPPEPSCLP